MNLASGKGRSLTLVWLVYLIFFVISFLSNILNSLVPDIIRDFRLSLTLTAFLPFAFFIAYGVMSIPSGFLVERWGDKRLIVLAFLFSTAGALTFAHWPLYSVAIVSLFAIGTGMAALQVAINPLLRVAGGAEHFAFHSAAAQFVFGTASFLSPYVYGYLVDHMRAGGQTGVLGVLARVTPASLPWVSIYWIFAACALVMAVFVAFLKVPRVERTADEAAGTLSMYSELARNRYTWLYFLAIFSYVGCEQGTSNWISEFLHRYHGFDPLGQGNIAVSNFWGLMTVGCLIGLVLLRLYDSRRVLVAFAVGAMLMLTLALFGSARVSLFAFPAIGLFASIMWPTLVSLGLNSVPKFHGPFAGILCTGIMGGAIVPLLIGKLGDVFGLRAGMLVLYLTFGYVLSVGLWARPLVNNAVRGESKQSATARAPGRNE